MRIVILIIIPFIQKADPHTPTLDIFPMFQAPVKPRFHPGNGQMQIICPNDKGSMRVTNQL